MEIFVYTVFGLLIVAMLYIVALIVRTQQTYRFLIRTLDRVSASARDDIANNDFTWSWRYDIFEAGRAKAFSHGYLMLFRPLTVESVYGTERHVLTRDEWLDTDPVV